MLKPMFDKYPFQNDKVPEKSCHNSNLCNRGILPFYSFISDR